VKAGVAILIAFVLIALGADLIAGPHGLVPFGPLDQPHDLSPVLQAPSRVHWLGTDDLGRDVFSRLVHGARVACALGVVTVALYVLLGAAIGLCCALSRVADLALGRLIDAALCIPALLLVLAIQGTHGPGGLVAVAVAIALAEWPHAARLVRAEALRVAALPHVLAARAIGASRWRVLVVHVLPLALAPLGVVASFGLAQAVLIEAALGTLGFGLAAPTPSWGELLAQAAVHPRWWLAGPPTIAIALVVLGARLSTRSGEGS